jgi:hypothetical protein
VAPLHLNTTGARGENNLSGPVHFSFLDPHPITGLMRKVITAIDARYNRGPSIPIAQRDCAEKRGRPGVRQGEKLHVFVIIAKSRGEHEFVKYIHFSRNRFVQQ